ncbi:hypothetical protein LCGC14_0876420 [marine sediment metagenome]|uniref:Uncharacterized protein n=1 Tax=marine sediment metagenome TaxID=412755 RepID=A0A0F9PNW2_9ZZZZ
MSTNQAIKELKLAGEQGALRIITNECASKSCNASGHNEGRYNLRDPRHFVIHDVVRLEGPNHRGQFKAHSAEGDWCQGQPEALLPRLLEAGKAGAVPPSNGR